MITSRSDKSADLIYKLEERGFETKKVVGDHQIFRAFMVALGKPEGHYQEIKQELISTLQSKHSLALSKMLS